MIAEFLIAMTVFLEAESDNLAGKIAVASVIRNRADGKGYISLISTIFKPKQFSCYNNVNNVSNGLKRLVNSEISQRAFFDSVKATFSKSNTDATYYTTKAIKKKYWFKSVKLVFKSDKHKFFKKREVENV